MEKWPGLGLKDSLQQRLASLAPLRTTEAGAVPAVTERFLAASQCGRKFLSQLIKLLLVEIDEGGDEWFDLVHDLFTRSGPLYIDVARREFARDVAYPQHVSVVSRALSEADSGAEPGRCALTGQSAVLQTGSFPQPKLPTLGEAYIFCEKPRHPAAWRYGRSAAVHFRSARQLIERLAASLAKLTAEHPHKAEAGRNIPSERPKQNDLLLAFVQPFPTRPLPTSSWGTTTLRFRKHRTEAHRTGNRRDQGEGRGGFSPDTGRICVLRKIDKGNSKIIYHRATSVGELWDAASTWAACEQNLPEWLRLPVPVARGEKAS